MIAHSQQFAREFPFDFPCKLQLLPVWHHMILQCSDGKYRGSQRGRRQERLHGDAIKNKQVAAMLNFASQGGPIAAWIDTSWALRPGPLQMGVIIFCFAFIAWAFGVWS